MLRSYSRVHDSVPDRIISGNIIAVLIRPCVNDHRQIVISSNQFTILRPIIFKLFIIYSFIFKLVHVFPFCPGWSPNAHYSDSFFQEAHLLHWNGPFKPWNYPAVHVDLWEKWFIPDPSKKFSLIRPESDG